jgi:hypothetical protein
VERVAANPAFKPSASSCVVDAKTDVEDTQDKTKADARR